MVRNERAAKKRKWTIFFPEEGKYICGRGNGIAWVSDPMEAQETARVMGGIVIDAEWLAVNFRQWQDDGIIPDEAKP